MLCCNKATARSNQTLPQLGDASALVLSPAQERILGKLYFNSLARQMPLVNDPLSLAYINNLGAKISNYTNSRGLKFHFFIVNDSSINAFAGPGGYIGINRGLILNTANESELAAVIAHEIAHVTQRHIARGMAHAKALKLPMLAGTLAAIALGASGHGSAANAGMIGVMSFGTSNLLNFTQGEEKEADQVGLKNLYRAGFDPKAMSSFFKKMQAVNQDYKNHHYNFSSHPSIINRLTEVENRSDRMRLQNKITSPIDYYLFKSRLLNLYRNTSNEKQPQWLTKAIQNSQQLASKKNITYHNNHDMEYAKNYGQALCLLQNNKTKAAKNILTHMKQQKPNNLWGELLYNQMLAKEGKTRLQIKQLNKLYKIFPDYRPVVIALTSALIKNQQTNQAIKIIQQQIINHPQQTIWYFFMAKCYNDKKLFTEATINQSKAYLKQAKGQLAYAQLKQLKRSRKLTEQQQQEINGLITRAEWQINYLQAMIPRSKP